MSETELEVDGAPARFTIAVTEDRWAAVRRHGDLVLTVTARGVAPADVRLAPVDGPLT